MNARNSHRDSGKKLPKIKCAEYQWLASCTFGQACRTQATSSFWTGFGSSKLQLLSHQLHSGSGLCLQCASSETRKNASGSSRGPKFDSGLIPRNFSPCILGNSNLNKNTNAVAMSTSPRDSLLVEAQGEAQLDGTQKAEEHSPVLNDHKEKEFIVSPVELDGPTIPRERHFSETSSTIAPQVISTTFSGGTVTHTSEWPESTDGRHELQADKNEPERDTGLVPRGIGTRWSSKTKNQRIIIVLIVTSIVITIVLLGSLLGVYIDRHHSNATPNADDFDILLNSQLAALTFQNVNNMTDKSVFFQLTSSNTLMRARSNATTNQQWVFENVSQSMIDGGSAIFPKAGTPLVAAAPDAVDVADLANFWIDLYFMSTSNVPFQIWSWSTPQTDPSKDLLWHQEGLQNYQVIFDTGFASGTQLAVYRDQCADGCSNSSRLLYQGANRDLMMADSTVINWMEWNITDLSDDVAGMPQLPQLELNSSIAISRFSPSTGQQPVGMRMYYDVSHQLEEFMLVNGTWNNGT